MNGDGGMGAFFTNIQIRKGEKNLDYAAVAAMMTKDEKLVPAEGALDADVVIAFYAPEGSEYVTLVSDLFDGDAPKQLEYAKMLSRETGEFILSIGCSDSDYLYVSLIDEEKKADLWAASGHFPDGPAPRRSAFAPWKKYVPDAAAFREAMRGPYVFAEEALDLIGPMLGFLPAQGRAGADEVTEDAPAARFFYKAEAPQGDQKPPSLRHFTSPVFFSLNTRNMLAIENLGGASRGIGVLLSGECIDHHEVKADEITLEYGDYKGRTSVPMKEITLEDGTRGLYGECSEFRIPDAVPEGLPPKKTIHLRFRKCVCLRFSLSPFLPVPEGTNVRPLRVSVIPLKNRWGWCSWYGPSHDIEPQECLEYMRQWIPHRQNVKDK